MSLGRKRKVDFPEELESARAGEGKTQPRSTASDGAPTQPKGSLGAASTASVTSLTRVTIDLSHQQQTSAHIKDDSSRLLSSLYAVTLILVGFILPLTEAVRDQWHETIYNLAFQVLIFTVAIAFLFYLQLRLIPRSNQGEGERGKADPRRGRYSTKRGQNDKLDSFSQDPTYSKTGATVGWDECLENAWSPAQPSIAETAGPRRPPTRSARSPGSTAMLRISSSTQNLCAPGAELAYAADRARAGGGGAGGGGGGVAGGGVREREGGEGEESETFIDLSQLGNAFSHEGSSLYVRFGALVFSICNIVYISLEIENSAHLRREGLCDALFYWWIFIFRLVFLVVQSFFLFKNIRVRISFEQPIARFGFMHLIATNMCVWLQTIINEVLDEYQILTLKLNAAAAEGGTNSSKGTPTPPRLELMALDDVRVTSGYARALAADATTAGGEEGNCDLYSGLLRGASPYLFPFVLEYSLVAMGTIAVMFSAVDEPTSDVIRGLHNWFQVQDVSTSPDPHSPDPSTHPDPHSDRLLLKSHRGVFVGFLLTAASFVSVFMFYWFEDKQDLIYFSTDLAIHILLLIATLVALFNLRKLGYISKPLSIDDVLLTVALSGALLFELTLGMSAVIYIGDNVGGVDGDAYQFALEVVKLCSTLVAGVQALLQVVLIVGGLRRYPCRPEHVASMPGRGTVMFLIIGNVAIWLGRTLQSKEISYETEIEFYGLMAALLLLNINLPLLFYFRFHSSICLADIWDSAYTPIHHKIDSARTQPDTGLDKRTPSYDDLNGTPRRLTHSSSVPHIPSGRHAPRQKYSQFSTQGVPRVGSAPSLLTGDVIVARQAVPARYTPRHGSPAAQLSRAYPAFKMVAGIDVIEEVDEIGVMSQDLYVLPGEGEEGGTGEEFELDIIFASSGGVTGGIVEEGLGGDGSPQIFRRDLGQDDKYEGQSLEGAEVGEMLAGAQRGEGVTVNEERSRQRASPDSGYDYDANFHPIVTAL